MDETSVQHTATTSTTTTILRTQAETDAYLQEHVRIGRCVPVTFAPAERICLDYWIEPHECCSSCGEARPGLRLDDGGHPREDCAWCKDSGSLITTWGTPQTQRWEDGERYGRFPPDEDEGPQVGPIRISGGVPRYALSLADQAERAQVKLLVG